MSDLLTNGVMQAGEFQCYDRRALASLAEAAAAVEQPEWGKEGPHDAGEYNSWPEVCAYLILLMMLMPLLCCVCIPCCLCCIASVWKRCYLV